jgi:hypothetical protein
MTGTNMCDKPLAGEYVPFAADHRRGAGLGRRLARSLGCHAQVIQLPSSAPLPELGQASLAVALVGSPMASRFASQAPAFDAGVLDKASSQYRSHQRLYKQRKTAQLYLCLIEKASLVSSAFNGAAT